MAEENKSDNAPNENGTVQGSDNAQPEKRSSEATRVPDRQPVVVRKPVTPPVGETPVGARRVTVRRPMAPPTPVARPSDTDEGPVGNAGSQTVEIVLNPEETGEFDAPLAEDKASGTAPKSEDKDRSDTDVMDKGQTGQLNVMGSSSQTIHIQLPDFDEVTDDKDVAPKFGQRSASGPPTVRLKPPPSVRVKKFATGLVEAEAKEQGQPAGTGTGKRTTSRLPLPSATAVESSRTVRIKPVAGTGQTVSPPRPGSQPLAPGPKPPSEAQVQASKSKTSRISLEAALTGASSADSSGAPKTIRLKRPSEAATVKMSPRPETPRSETAFVELPPSETGEVDATQAKAATGSPKQTARLPEVGGDAALTRRKTIKVRRPTPSPTLSTKEDAGATSEGPTLPPGLQRKAALEVDIVSPFFPICAIAALFVTVTLIWVLAAQIIGPNRSLTQVSIWTTGPELWMPGRAVQAE